MRTATYLTALAVVGCAAASVAMPLREWDWHMPGDVYKELDFTDRAGVDRAVKLFQQAADAEWRNEKVTDVIPRYRNAAGEWRKVQVQAESGDGNVSLLAYAVFMQGYARQQAHDRNEAIKLFNEVLDLYDDQKFISIPARYMLSQVHREMGDIKKANQELTEIVDDHAADGHKIYFNVLRSLAGAAWEKCDAETAAEYWSKIVFSKGKPDDQLWSWSRNDLCCALVVARNFNDLEAAICARIDPAKRQERADALASNAGWVCDADRYGHHGITQFLDRRYPGERNVAARKQAVEKIRREYIAWFDGLGAQFGGLDDGWQFGMAKLRCRTWFEKKTELVKRAKSLENLVKSAKPDKIDGRARALAKHMAAIGDKDSAREIAALAKNGLFRLRLQSDVENDLGEYKAACMYLNEYVNTQPPPDPGTLRQAKYDLAWMYRHRLGEVEKALKLYLDINDPPRSLWDVAECQRQLGKKKEAYTTLMEIISVFPNSAPDAVMRTGAWREQDGEKEKAIACYRQLMKHPKWKQSSASSQAHQALERLGVATGGAMTNEVR